MNETISAYEAKTHLSQLLTKVQQGHRITITRHEIPVAILSPIQRSDPVETVINNILARRCSLQGAAKFREEGRR